MTSCFYRFIICKKARQQPADWMFLCINHNGHEASITRRHRRVDLYGAGRPITGQDWMWRTNPSSLLAESNFTAALIPNVYSMFRPKTVHTESESHITYVQTQYPLLHLFCRLTFIKLLYLNSVFYYHNGYCNYFCSFYNYFSV